jgi:hypothetical protein
VCSAHRGKGHCTACKRNENAFPGSFIGIKAVASTSATQSLTGEGTLASVNKGIFCRVGASRSPAPLAPGGAR